MLVELLGKGGQVCQAAREGKLRCPLIIRPTSEDAITGNVFQALRAIDPRWWLSQLLNTALGTRRFRQQIYRGLKIELWRNARRYPADWLPWNEGSTQVDVTISWENPATTVFIESKYLAQLSGRTQGNDGRGDFPADQLIRNIRIGLWETGWQCEAGLFPVRPRSFAAIVFAPTVGNPLVAKYRTCEQLRAFIPNSKKLCGLPEQPFVGEISYGRLSRILQATHRWMHRSERQLAADLCEYLRFKLNAAKEQRGHSAVRSADPVTNVAGEILEVRS